MPSLDDTVHRMQGTLVLGILTIRSSYARQIELPLGADAQVPDTLQWWITATGSWRIRTYAIDHDIHTHQVDGNRDDVLALAFEGNRKHYGDVLAAEHLVQFTDCQSSSEVRDKLRAIGLEPGLEVAAGRFAFWKPDDAKYSSKTSPLQ
jgi:hypothetical protein